MKASRGLSLVELMIGTLLVFTAATTLCMVLASSSHYVASERARSEALQMAQQQTQLLAVSQGWQHYGGQGAPSPSPGLPPMLDSSVLGGSVTNESYAHVGEGEPGAGLYDLRTVISFQVGSTPNPGLPPQTITLDTLSMNCPLRDVTTYDAPDGTVWVAFMGPAKNDLINMYHDTKTSPQQLQLPGMVAPPTPGGQPTSTPPGLVSSGLAIAQNPGAAPQIVTTNADYEGGFEVTPGASAGIPFASNLAWNNAVITTPSGSPNGIACDPTGTEFWCVVGDHRCICHQAGGAWTTLSPPPTMDPLVQPVNIAWDRTNGIIWLTDQGNLCLRSYTIGQNQWSGPIRAWGMGRPRGVAVDLQGNVYTADALSLWGYTFGSGFGGACPSGSGHLTLLATFAALDPPTSPSVPIGLQYNVESLCYDNANKSLYLNATQNLDGWLYKWTAGTFEAVTRALPAPNPSPAP